MQRDSFICRFCGESKETLHVHHTYYSSEAEGPWDYYDHSLITLCRSCHNWIHNDATKQDMKRMDNLFYGGLYNQDLVRALEGTLKKHSIRHPYDTRDSCAGCGCVVDESNLGGSDGKLTGKIFCIKCACPPPQEGAA